VGVKPSNPIEVYAYDWDEVDVIKQGVDSRDEVKHIKE